jgi:hypothetical protein
MPAPTIEPTTMAVKVRRENFCSDGAPLFGTANVCCADDAIPPLTAVECYTRKMRLLQES